MTVYILRQIKSDYFKIGHTDHESPEARRRACQTGNPRRVNIYRILPGAPQALETKMHQLLATFRTDGGSEWFELPEDKLLNILSISQEETIHELATIRRHYTETGEGHRDNRYYVRPLRGRQQNSTPTRIEDVFYAGQPDSVPPNDQRPIIFIGKEHNQRGEIDWGEGIQGDG